MSELKTYTLSELVRETGISRKTLQEAVDCGDLMGFPAGERVRFNQLAVDNYLHLNKWKPCNGCVFAYYHDFDWTCNNEESIHYTECILHMQGCGNRKIK